MRMRKRAQRDPGLCTMSSRRAEGGHRREAVERVEEEERGALERLRPTDQHLHNISVFLTRNIGIVTSPQPRLSIGASVLCCETAAFTLYYIPS